MENIKKKEVVNPSIKILGFDPKSPEENIFPVQMTPEMAKYILVNHNKHNRKFVPAQKNAIYNICFLTK